MSSRKCTADEFAAAIMDELQSYSQEITAETKKNVDIVANEVNAAIKANITFEQHSGDYVKAFRVAKTYEDGYKKVKTWYVKDPQYRLTHLLENGHAMPQGGRSKAFPHIKYGAELAEQRMMELSEKTVKNAGH
jgi:hypothetical protein